MNGVMTTNISNIKNEIGYLKSDVTNVKKSVEEIEKGMAELKQLLISKEEKKDNWGGKQLRLSSEIQTTT